VLAEKPLILIIKALRLILTPRLGNEKIPLRFTFSLRSLYVVNRHMANQKQKEQKGSSHYIENTIFITRGGSGYVVASEDKTIEDIKIENRFLNTALHGDYVRVLLHPKTMGQRQEGEVVTVLARTKEEFVGTVRKKNGVCFVDPQDARMYADIIIPSKEQKGVSDGDKVLVRIVKWEDGSQAPIGTIRENLGKSGVHETEMQAILRDRGFIEDFPKTVLNEAQDIQRRYKTLFEEETQHRKDIRNIPTFTIDPEDAKDFDDALSIQKLPNGNYEVGIHIADVSFFVKRKSALDVEAARRSTSIYLVDRTVPMLPSILSNDLCSLRPDEDRLTFSAILELTKDGIVKKRWFGKTIIHSDKRFTYAEAQKIMEQETGVFHEELFQLNSFAKKLRGKREERGALAFESDEVKFVLDENGKPIKIIKKERLETNKLIEEFMILANAEVAQFMSGTDKKIKESFIYRVHDLPNEDKIKELERLMHALGYSVPTRKKELTSKDIAILLKKVTDAPHQEMVHMLAVRAMAKAVYATKNIGHFGLSLKHYTHFTSPIRRYTDLVVHRLLLHFLNSGKKLLPEELREYEALSRYATQMEISANDAERTSIKYKQAEYMSEYIGQTYDGTITGLTERGIFVAENETRAEGMVRLGNLRDDYYVFDEKKFSIIGRKKKKKYSLGDRVKIKVKNVNLEARQIDYVFV